ncbi:NAD(P)-dependent oxidoreductase [Streptomyces sp. 8P21H-1]|uniref:NAD(P)-dependent oxidoreductase n=1 Tax=Streptomyces sp. 8P21H-1 TaxID=2737048 RepID=UPI001570D3D8|nr:NAD(P)-binding oxidoreductase [Streptomyces sp. 8P21H-1]NSL43342.1 SDR family oxidoreductase [Streptomyces sp. 8P21H-1]
MHLTILAASGATGLALTRQALERGHTVTAIARTPARIVVPDSPQLTRVAADVHDIDTIAEALRGSESVLSGLGWVRGEKQSGVLSAGARAVVAARPDRIIWLGAYGTGPSAQAAGLPIRFALKGLGTELADKVASDGIVLEAGGTVFHAGPLSKNRLSPARRTVGLDEAPKRFFPARVSRDTVAAAMLDEVENPRYPGRIALPLER